MKLKELEKRLKQEPDNLGLRVQVAGLMREAGRSLEAVELYRSVALAYRDQGRAQQAIAVCKSILEIAPDDPACRGLLAMLQGRSPPARFPSAAEAETVTRTRTPPTMQTVTAAKGTSRITDAVTVPNVPSLRAPTAPPERATTSAPTAPEPGRQPRQPTRPPQPPTRPPQQPTRPPEPARRSSLDETPLPQAVPYHVVDPTSRPEKMSARELDGELPSVHDADTRPGGEERSETAGLAQAARRISGLIGGTPYALDVSEELDTRQLKKIATEQIRKLERLTPNLTPDPDAEENPPPRDTVDELPTAQVGRLTPAPRVSDDEVTVPRDRPGLDDEDD